MGVTARVPADAGALTRRSGVVARKPVSTTPLERPVDGLRSVRVRQRELPARTACVESGQMTVARKVVEERTMLEVPISRDEAYVKRAHGKRAGGRAGRRSNVPTH